jgi:predicted dehydrogenase
MVPVEKPDTITAIAETDRGIVASNLQFWAGLHGSNRIELYGEEGTVIYHNQGDAILGGTVRQDKLEPLTIPADLDDPWRVEADFAKLIRGEISEPLFSFLDGVRNMEYLEAVNQSWRSGEWIDLPS